MGNWLQELTKSDTDKWIGLWGIGATQSLPFMGMAFYVCISVLVFWCRDCSLYFALDIYAEKNFN
jgi:hypothetical protein